MVSPDRQPGNGYALLLNGDNSGYVQGIYSHADYTAATADATNNMKLPRERAKMRAQNLEQWAPQLRDLMKQIVASPPGPDFSPAVREAVALSENTLKGAELNENERIEPIPCEGGAETAYEHAFYMADIVIGLQKRTSRLGGRFAPHGSRALRPYRSRPTARGSD